MAAPKGNKFALGNTGGVEPFYKSPDELNDKVNEYFNKTICINPISKETTNNSTTSGLALFLGFSSRQSLYDYRDKDVDGEKVFSYIIKRALLVIENKYEEALSEHSPTGAIFALKNMGWKDKTETDITTKGESINKEMVLPDGQSMDDFKKEIQDLINEDN